MGYKLVGPRKITVGFVTQVFDGKGQCVEQEFTAADDVCWEDEHGETIEAPEHDDHLLEMRCAIPDKRKRDYVRTGGCKCPHCGGEELRTGEYSACIEAVSLPVTCGTCGKSWVDRMTLTGVDFDEEN